MSKELVDQFNSELKTLRDYAEKGVGENQTAIKNLTESLSSASAKMETAIAEKKAVDDALKASEKRIDELEANLKRGAFDGKAEEKEAAEKELKAFEKLLTMGEKSFSGRDEAKTLRTDSQIDGGYLAPRVLSSKIIEKIVEVSPIRSIANVIRIKGKSIELPTLTTEPTSYWVGEADQIDAAAGAKFGLEELKAEKMGTFEDITLEMIADGIIDVPSYLAKRVGLSQAKLEGAAYVNGDGVKKAEGFMFNSLIGSYASGKADGFTGDTFLGVQGEFKDGYDLKFVMNRKTFFQHCLTLKGGDGQYLLAGGLNTKGAKILAGLDVVFAADMPDVGAGLYPVAVGDFSMGYQIVDNDIITVVEDNSSQMRNGKRRWYFFKRTGGQVVLPEAIKKIKVATSL